MIELSKDRAFPEEMDRCDPLARFREHFYIPGDVYYLLGNSLGLLSKEAEAAASAVMEEWKTMAIKGWLDGRQPWFYFAETLGAKAARLVGAEPEEVVATGTTTANIHSLVSSLYRPAGRRTKILADSLNFPTDIYALRSQVQQRGLDPEQHLILVPGDDRGRLNEQKIVEQMNDDVALAFFPSVLYRSGQLLDMELLTREAHRRDILIGFDCSHSAGVVPHSLNQWGVDFGVWCSYKYINGGPGGVGFLYLNKRHFDKEPGLAGWFGYNKEKQFDLRVEFESAQHAGGWQISAPSIPSAAALGGALELLLQAGIEAIRDKSVSLTSYLVFLFEQLLSAEPHNIAIITPRDPAKRGGHIAITHPEEGFRICQALKSAGVVVDFRPPNIIRFAPSPLYTSYQDIFKVAMILKEIMDRAEYQKFEKSRKAIT
jgi:kynureninase